MTQFAKKRLWLKSKNPLQPDSRNLLQFNSRNLLQPNSRFWIAVIGLIFCVIVIANSGFFTVKRGDDFTTQRGRVLATDDSNLLPDPYVDNMLTGTQVLKVEILTGSFKGQVFDYVENKLSPLFNNYATKNIVMLFNIRSEDGVAQRVDIFGYSRDFLIYALIGLFLLLLVAIGRKKGLYSAIGLLFTLITVIFFMIPFILRGHSPILMAILTAAFTSVFSIFMVGGVSLRSAASICGILLGVTAAAVIGIAAGKIGHISGLNTGDAEGTLFLAKNLPLKIPELLFAGIIIATLGAGMDVSMSITSAIFEVYQANPGLNMRQLYNSGMNIGRDTMGTMSNTLILAFAGSSINVLIIISLYNLPYICLINLNLFVVEMIQGISGAVGLILTVPVTAALTAAVVTGNKIIPARGK